MFEGSQESNLEIQRDYGAYLAVHPPSTTIMLPVVKLLAGLAK